MMPEIPILRYHSIEPQLHDDFSIKLGNLEKHIDLFRSEGYTTITCKDLHAYLKDNSCLPPKPLLITFDNGLRNYYEFAADYLIKNNCTATFFVCGEWALKSSCKDPGYFDRFMDVDQLRRMNGYGFEIGLHPYGSYSTGEPSPDDLRSDIENGILFFERFSINHMRVVAFAPEWNILRNVSYKTIHALFEELEVMLNFTGSGTSHHPHYDSRYKLNRLSVSEDMTKEQLLKILKSNTHRRFF